MTVQRLLHGATLVVALLIAQPAASEYKLVTEMNAVELAPRNIILPGDAGGMMTFRSCDSDDCGDVPYSRVQLTTNTRFTVDGKPRKFAEFRREFAIIKRGESSYALVTYETATNTVTSLEIAR